MNSTEEIRINQQIKKKFVSTQKKTLVTIQGRMLIKILNKSKFQSDMNVVVCNRIRLMDLKSVNL